MRPAEEDGQGVGDGRQDAEPQLGDAEELPACRQQEHRERRLIDVPRGQPLAAGDVIEFVAEDPVASEGVDGQMGGQRGQRHPEHEADIGPVRGE